MNITLLTENLQKKLPFALHAVSLRTQLPILTNILLEGKSGKLFLSSTDLEIGISVEIPAKIEEEGALTVPAKTFSETISALPPGKIKLYLEENTLVVKTAKTKSRFQIASKEEFPKLYQDKGERLMRLKAEDAQKEFAKVVFAASSDVTRPALSGVLVTTNEKGSETLLVATDGYRLSLKQYKEKSENKQENKTLLISSRALREVISMKEEGDITIYVSGANNQVLFMQEETTLVGRLIDAQFPAYEKIIPQDFSTQVVFDKDELEKAVKLCAIFAREAGNIVKFSIQKAGVVVSSQTQSVGENSVDVEAVVKGEENEIAFNARYLLDLLSHIEEPELVLEMSGPLSPGVFKIKGDPTFLHLIMPIRVQS